LIPLYFVYSNSIIGCSYLDQLNLLSSSPKIALFGSNFPILLAFVCRILPIEGYRYPCLELLRVWFSFFLLLFDPFSSFIMVCLFLSGGGMNTKEAKYLKRLLFSECYTCQLQVFVWLKIAQNQGRWFDMGMS
jgi:hypothetical protein